MATKRKATETITSIPRKRTNTYTPPPHLWLPPGGVVVLKQEYALDIYAHETPLRSLFEQLPSVIDPDPSARELHSELACHIINKCMAWLGEIFRASIEKGEDLPDAFKALSRADLWIHQLNTPVMKSLWPTQTTYKLTSSTGASVYQNTTTRVLSHLWRDFALVAIILQDQNTLSSILHHNTSRSDHSPPLVLWRGEPARDLFMDEKEMLDAEIERLNRALDSLREIDPDGGVAECLQPYWRGKRVNGKGERVEDEWYAGDVRMGDAVVVLAGLLGL